MARYRRPCIVCSYGNLHKSISNNCINELKITNNETNTKIKNSIKCDDFEYIKNLLENKVCIDLDKILLVALYYGSLEIIKYLINSGVNIPLNTKQFNTNKNWLDSKPFNDLCSLYHMSLSDYTNKRRLDVVKYFVEIKCIEVNTYYGSLALINAVKYGRLDIVKYLIEDCENDGIQSCFDNDVINKALIKAIEYWHLDIVKYLIWIEADINFNNNEPLIIAIREKQFEIIKYLVENGANAKIGYYYAVKYYSTNQILKYLMLFIK